MVNFTDTNYHCNKILCANNPHIFEAETYFYDVFKDRPILCNKTLTHDNYVCRSTIKLTSCTV